MTFNPTLDLSSIFSGFGARLNALEQGGVDATIQLAIDRIGIDFRTKGPRYTPLKTPLNTPLPSGASYLNPVTITTSNTDVTFEGWDLSGYCFYLTQGQTTLIDTKVGRRDTFVVDRRNAASFSAQWCDLDGMKQAFSATMIVSRGTNGVLSITDSLVHGAGLDTLSVSSNSITERCWIYDGGNNIIADPHIDLAQMLTAAGNNTNIVFRDNLLDTGDKEAAAVLRLVTERADSNLDGVIIEGNMILRNSSFEDVPIAIGAKTLGGPVSNVRIRNNWLRYGTSSPIYPYDVPSGEAVWQNNRLADTSDLIAPPPGWSS